MASRKYGKKAGEKVERVMHEKKKGTLRSGRSGKKVTSMEAGDRDRVVRSAAVRREGAEEEGVVEKTLACFCVAAGFSPRCAG